MKKIKWTMMTLAVVLSIGAAFAFRPKPLVSGVYYFNGEGYVPAGTEGVNYVCISSTEICTYVKSGNNYVPYENLASYTPIDLNTPSKPASPEKK